MKTVKKTITKLIALLTLAALMVSGATVTVLAEGLFDDTTDEVMADCFPDDEIFAEDEVFSDDEEIVACAVEETVGEMDFVMGEEGLTGIFSAEGEAEAMEEIVEIEELDEISLGELTGEADPEDIEEGPEDRQQLMADLITMAIEDTRDQGIYAALNATFATLADNATYLANPETGVIEVNGPEIVSFTYRVVQNNFDTTSEETMGAIEAATSRASDAGYLDELGGDPDLNDMAAEEGAAEAMLNATREQFKNYFEMGLDMLGEAHPVFKTLNPLLKAVIGAAFAGEQSDPAKEIKAKMDEIDKKLDSMEQNMKDHMENVVVLADLGNKTGSVATHTETLRQRVSNINRNSNLNQAEKISQIAALYGTPVVNDVENAMVCAINAFRGDTDVTLDRKSIFEAAYRRACEEVMFSGEALDAIAPYIARQIAYYVEGYAVLSQVYDAYEKVYGASSLTETRDVMQENLDGDKTPFALSTNYFKMNRYIFVNKSNTTSIKLRDKLYTVVNIGKELWDGNRKRISEKAPDYMKNNPLTQSQVEELAKYCAGKKTTLFEFLINKMHFTPYMPSSLSGGRDGVSPFSLDIYRSGRYYAFLPEGKNVDSNHIYLATGAQTQKHVYEGSGFSAQERGYMNLTLMTKVGAKNEKTEFYDRGYAKYTVLFFEKG